MHPDPTEPLAALEAILAAHPNLAALLRPTDPRDQRTVAEICRLYLQHAADEISPQTLEDRRRDLTRFVAAFGERTVASMTPLDVKTWLFAQTSWKSPWKRFSAKAAVQRAFNWAVEQRLIRENTCRGVKLHEERKPGRDMRADEFQAVLRHSDLPFRRYLIAAKLSGARPMELGRLEWQHIRWAESVAILPDHKTRKKTGRPRIIYLVPQLLKLLAIIRRDHHGPCAVEFRRILEASPTRAVHARDVTAQLRDLGFSHRAIWKARHKIGAIYRRIRPYGKPFDCMAYRQTIQAWVAGGWNSNRMHAELTARHGFTGSVWAVRRFVRWLKDHPHGDGRHELCDNDEKAAYVYELPDKPRAASPADTDRIFLNQKWRPWTRHAIAYKLHRLRRKLGLPSHCRMYAIRHMFATTAVKRTGNLKAVAELLGHARTEMIERVYCHLNNDPTFLLHAANLAVGLANNTKPLPLPIDDVGLAKLIATYPRATKKPPKVRKQRDYTKLLPAHVAAWTLYQEAVASRPDLARATDGAVYRWLREHSEHAGNLPPTEISFIRYLRTARRHLAGTTKRQQRRATLERSMAHE
jgi:integrase